MMLAAYVLLFKWMLACAGSALAGLAVWLLMRAATQAWPALLPRRGVWLAAQAVVLAAALLPFLPRSPQLDVAPTVTLSATEAEAIGSLADTPPQAATTPATTPEGLTPNGVRPCPALRANCQPAAAASAIPSPDLDQKLLIPMVWAAIYLAGLAVALNRLRHARRLWRGLLASARPLSPQTLAARLAISASQQDEITRHQLRVMETDAAIPPMLIGLRHPVLLLPATLRELSVEQQHMIVAHELHHWRVRDPLCLTLAGLLQTLFWFNPALRWLGAKMTWALELSCDQQVLAGRPQAQRKQYAAALLRQWQTQMTYLPVGMAAFGGHASAQANDDSIAARIRQMQQATLPALQQVAAWTVGAAMVALLAAGAVLQPALAISVDTRPIASVVAPAASGQGATGALAATEATEATETPLTHWRNPLQRMRVAGFFGVQRDVSSKPHPGIDLAAPRGTPVMAAAAGTVIAAGELAENDGRYGTTVIIESGAIQTLYAHLSSVAVRPGQRVAAGQRIGAVGASGFATGPHLHFELREHQRLVDPATVLADLDAHATQHALKTRRQQLGH